MRSSHHGRRQLSRLTTACLAIALLAAPACSTDDGPTASPARARASTSTSAIAAATSTSTAPATDPDSTPTPSPGDQSTTTLQQDGITSTDPGGQAAELETMLDADPDDVCTARRVFVLADRMTGPATPEQAEAQTNLRVRVIGLWASLAPDEMATPAAALTAAALALGTEARSSNYSPVSLRAGVPRALRGAAYLAAVKKIQAWMDRECGPEDY